MQNDIILKYREFIKNFTELHNNARQLPIGDFCEVEVNPNPSYKVMTFAPHPDDECIIGALPLRLINEHNAEVVNVAVTLGSNKDRKRGRLEELTNACKSLGFSLLVPEQMGLDGVYLKTKENSPDEWLQKVDVIADIITTEKPDMVLFPHDNDFNSTHIGVHHLVTDALNQILAQDPEFKTSIIETEFWHMMEDPNLMIGLSEEDEALLVYALSAHTKEVERNPYHLNHPARMLDNVMRGAEVVGGQGGHAPKMDFAMLYRHSTIVGGKIIPVTSNKVFGVEDDLKELL
ncbi:MAG: PIG-L family deacetylase [Lentisphaerales bacterium]|nr:PIG-L family deacetylase [Lentisphaerales bacterium]